jgi:hypothetical protein
MLKRFDENGDGQLDDEERAALRSSFGSPPTAAGAPPEGTGAPRGEGRRDRPPRQRDTE